MHGMGDDRRAYRFLAPALAAAGYRVATLDVRGHGESSAGWPGYGASVLAPDALALVEHLGGPAVLLGHSSTARAAVWAAAEAPERVAGLVLIGPFVRDTRPNLLARLAVAVVGRSATLWAMYYRSLYPAAKPADLDAYVAAMKQRLREPGRLAALRAVMGATPEENRERLAEVRCPALVVMGTRDGDFPDPTAEARLVTERLAPRGTLKLVDGAGHYPHVEMPEVTAAALLAFLAGS
jgi:pimeloyl-ACP methyl ester carboxylesterase